MGQYFVDAKNWWDVKKTSILSSTFWCPLLYDIKYNISDNNLLYQVMNGIFNAKVKYKNTKETPLIPDGTIKSSQHIKYFLYKIHQSLNIDKWLKEEIQKETNLDSKKNNVHKSYKRSESAKNIAQRLRVQLLNLMNETHHEKNNNIINNNDDNKNNDVTLNVFPSEDIPLEDVIINTNNDNNNNNNNITYDAIIFALADKFIENNNNMNIYNNNTNNGGYNGYNGCHGSQQYNASQHRYNPFNR